MKIQQITSILIIVLFSFSNAIGQEKESEKKGFVFTGYVQAQYQHFFIPDTTGAATKHFAHFSGGNFVNRFTYDRFTIRRGRIALKHLGENHKAVFSFDISERGLGVKDVYLDYTEPFIKSFTLTAGMFNRPFGQEIELSSSLRETPERSRVVQTLFPNERDLGFALGFKMPEESKLYFLNAKLAVINGNGTAYETDNYKDWTGRIGLDFGKEESKIKAKIGFSFYKGYINHIHEPVDTVSSNTTTKYYIYNFQDVEDSTGRTKKSFVMDTTASFAAGTMGGKVNRDYMGIDGELTLKSPFGKLIIRGEYIWGTQPVAVLYKDVEQAYIIHNGMNTFSPTGPMMGVSWPMYDQPQPYNPVGVGPVNKFHHTFIRRFNGGYLYFIQELFETKHQIVFKYDWYDPNSEIEGKDITYDEELYSADPTYVKPYVSPADVKFETIGIGFNYFVNDNIKLCIYYEHVQNEKVDIEAYQGDIRLGRMPSPGFTRDIKDDAFTLRLQYKF